MNLFLKWSDRKTGLLPKLLILIPAAALFPFLIPYALLVWLPRLDVRLGLPSFSIGVVNYIIGAVLILLGMSYALWSIAEQLFKADGTPVPLTRRRNCWLPRHFHTAAIPCPSARFLPTSDSPFWRVQFPRWCWCWFSRRCSSCT